jgi:PIN domain nuclease of toxin-antitoxin system
MLQKNSNSPKPKKALLDSSAIFALLKKESGYEVLEEVIATSAISTVNLSEIASVLTRSNINEDEIDEIIKDLVPEVIPFTDDIAIYAGKLLAVTNKHGLSLGDRACIATGIIHNMSIYTTDKAWLECKIPNADIILIR